MITLPLACVGPFDPAQLQLPPPTHWSRSPITLAPSPPPRLVPLGEVEQPDDEGVRLQAFAARHSLAGAVVDGVSRPPDDPGYFIVFHLCRPLPDAVQVWTLSQVASPVYADLPQKQDYLMASKVGKKGPTAQGVLPRWKVADALWPTVDGQAMTFVSDVDLLDTPLNRAHATTGERVFWFAARTEAGWRWKAVTQAMRFQSAEDHEQQEARRGGKA